MSIQAIIIDDELHAREGIRLRLAKYPEIVVVDECSSGSMAVDSINKFNPDLIFLDIQMPEMNGFEVLQNISVPDFPIVIFVTAYDTYALKAFEFHALEYLLKPINRERFEKAVEKALEEVKHRNLKTYTAKLLSFVKDYAKLIENPELANEEILAGEKKEFLKRLMIKVKENIIIISISDIDWLESAGNYIYVHSMEKKHLFRETLASLESKLDPRVFVRIHRSAIVNIEKIKSLRTNEHGDYDLFLLNGTKLKLSRTYKQHFQKIIGTSL